MLKPKSKSKKSPLKKAKDDAWDQFSIFIRTRDCLRFTGDPDEGMCVTCKQWFPFKKLQAGHFIAGRTNGVLFDEEIVYTQCGRCNRNPPYGLGGNYVEYFSFMLKEHNNDLAKIDEFRARKHLFIKYTLQDYLDIRETYKMKTQQLLIGV